jgi:peptide/nickel transport system permease protein
MKKFLRKPRFAVSLVFIALVVLVAILADFLAPQDPLAMDTKLQLLGSSGQHLLGTDEFGRDILSRLIYGARPSLMIALGAVSLAAILGVPLGLISAYVEGWTSQLIMRVVDLTFCFPPILVAMMIVGLLGPGTWTLIIVIGVLYTPTFARQTYAATLDVKHLDYVEAARALGAGDVRILTRAFLPNILPPIIVQASLSIAAAILLESGLSFLGLGVVPPTPSWGQMIGFARGYMTHSPGYVLWPALTIAITILAINTLGDELRDYLDPRIRRGQG